MTTRYESEARFHDAIASGEASRAAGRFYAVNRSSWQAYRELLLAEAARHDAPRILEYGSGAGAYSSLALAEAGHPSLGIDISPASVQAAQERVAREFPGVPVEYRTMNAEQLELEDDSFDLVCGNGILHHLDLERAYGEVARVLRPGGAAVFSEPLGHNPLINLYRRLTPEQRTADEHPLTLADVSLAGRFFGRVEPRYFHLLALAATPLRATPLFGPLLAALDRADRALLDRVPPARRLAWIVVYRVSEPRWKAATAPRP